MNFDRNYIFKISLYNFIIKNNNTIIHLKLRNFQMYNSVLFTTRYIHTILFTATDLLD